MIPQPQTTLFPGSESAEMPLRVQPPLVLPQPEPASFAQFDSFLSEHGADTSVFGLAPSQRPVSPPLRAPSAPVIVVCLFPSFLFFCVCVIHTSLSIHC